jgi:hypothetical protein
MDSSVRKQVYELTADDLQKFPVWEFAIDEEGDEGQDEATVRPFPLDQIDERLDGSIVVAAVFELADGTKLPGYLTPRDDPQLNLANVQPQIITPQGQVMFWHGRCPVQAEQSYKMLDRESRTVFPIRFKTVVQIDNRDYSGEIPGFLALGDDFEAVTIIK